MPESILRRGLGGNSRRSRLDVVGVERLRLLVTFRGVTLLLDVPRTPNLPRSYASMVEAARHLGGRMVDDNGNSVDERALAAIGAEIESLRGRMAEIGVEPGSPLAQRLFS